ncbi:hypothetical protein WR25_19951 [Diploscapter pachys]|uniref:CNNM transmembrane domain-containing protein n=1 Tax=Diploscapter pachys TaxID=2018661 RepID=A0A2A2KB43_9BILA|nr:hypothetical protein WR25_19951 [Diploscapter pachys]
MQAAEPLPQSQARRDSGNQPENTGNGLLSELDASRLRSDEVRVSGLRIEVDDAGGHHQEALVKYERNEAIVKPNMNVKVVVFGSGLNKANAMGFSLDPSCQNVALRVEEGGFTGKSNVRAEFAINFPMSENGTYHLCLRRQGEKEFELSDSLQTKITTRTPPKVTYLPLHIQIAIITVLLVLSGLFSGLNLGLMTLNPQELKLIMKSGSKTERRYAEMILPVRKHGNFLLCTLLLGNVCVNSGISILLDDLTGSGYLALIVSSAGIVIFGEIFPQALCVKKGLAVGANTIWLTRIFMILTGVASYPISKILDCILGEEVVSYDRNRLIELIRMSNEDGQLQDELRIAVGAMEMNDKTVSNVMTKIDDVFMLPDTTILSTKTVAEILRMGYTRIPVYSGSRNDVVSLLFVKDLALLNPDGNFTIQTVCNYHQHPLRFVMEDTPLRVMLDEFKKGEYHLAMVQRVITEGDADPRYELVGVVTLEDIVEEILQAEIVDETDAIMDNVNRTRRKGAQARDVSCLIEGEDPSVISVQLQLVTTQFLSANVRAFHQPMISQPVLERLIRQHCHKLNFTHLPDLYDSASAVLPRTSRLYTKGEYTDRFILILEGRALVTIGQDEMKFEAGPWHSFGKEMLEKLVDKMESEEKKTAAGGTNGVTAGGDKEKTDSHHSLTAIGAVEAAGKRKWGFVPDFSVIVREECTYLEITVSAWLLAYKSTLMSRGGTRWVTDSMLRLTDPVPHLVRTDAGGLQRCFTEGTPLNRRVRPASASPTPVNSPDSPCPNDSDLLHPAHNHLAIFPYSPSASPTPSTVTFPETMADHQGIT